MTFAKKKKNPHGNGAKVLQTSTVVKMRLYPLHSGVTGCAVLEYAACSQAKCATVC